MSWLVISWRILPDMKSAEALYNPETNETLYWDYRNGEWSSEPFEA